MWVQAREQVVSSAEFEARHSQGRYGTVVVNWLLTGVLHPVLPGLIVSGPSFHAQSLLGRLRLAVVLGRDRWMGYMSLFYGEPLD